ncbi:30S ribosomal protein S17 [Candidatus Gottesmanbacteria bacterium]|nr:30S ribosomal protein S17 [Candidatus Gottesmanbacteria bacterium]
MKKTTGGREFTGKVVGLSTKNTIKVELVRLYRHPMYKKILRKTKNFLCHVEGIDCRVGDTVVIKETKPISKNKHFLVIKKV